MRVAVLGATGVFGSRLALLLARDGHQVIAVSRKGPVRVDRAGDLTPLWAAAPEAVVDAAGPFHGYGGDPYRLPRECIAHGIHYLDLADDAAFCAGIGALDDKARAAGVVVLSGLSSVPALSSAAVAALVEGLTEIDTIDTAILPGNRAPRGRAVIAGILSRVGLPFTDFVDGERTPVRNWSDPADYSLGPGLMRRGYQIEVPDQHLFPEGFGARSVIFRAGLELPVMGGGLALLSWARATLGLPMQRWIVDVVRHGAMLLSPFGSDTGGMIVTVTGLRDGAWVKRAWRLIARAGEGPFVPAVAARAALRDIAVLAPGARPAVSAVTLAACEAAMADLAVTIAREEGPVVPLFARIPGFAALPSEVRALHDHAGPRRFVGHATVERGRGLVARIIAGLFRFPAAGADVPVTVLKWPVNGGEDWLRDFAGRRFRSRLRAEDGGMTESSGLFTFRLHLHVVDGALHFPVAGWRLGPIPLPRGLAPRSIAREEARDGRFHFDMSLHAPLGLGLIVRYRGVVAGSGAKGGEEDGLARAG